MQCISLFSSAFPPPLRLRPYHILATGKPNGEVQAWAYALALVTDLATAIMCNCHHVQLPIIATATLCNLYASLVLLEASLLLTASHAPLHPHPRNLT